MTVRAERRAMIALLTAFALLVQAMIPSLAMAASPDGGASICTQQGLQAAPTDGDSGQTSTPHECQHCICPAIVADTPAPVVSVRSVAYAVAVASVVATPRGVRPQARAPPRPPGQGPPISNA